MEIVHRARYEPDSTKEVRRLWMELGYRMAVGILYFGQMAALMLGYTRTHNRQVFYHAERESRLVGGIRGMWALVIIASMILYAVFPIALRWGQMDLPHALRWFGLFGGVTADVFILWTVATLGKNISATLQIHKAHRLVTEGPYRYVRHPLYSGGVLLFVSLALIASNWIIGVLGIGFQVFLIVVRTPGEEQMLCDHFGEAYQQYMKQTGGLVPKIRWAWHRRASSSSRIE